MKDGPIKCLLCTYILVEHCVVISWCCLSEKRTTCSEKCMGHKIGKPVCFGSLRQSAVKSTRRASVPVSAERYCSTHPSRTCSAPPKHQINNNKPSFVKEFSTTNNIMGLHVKARSEIYPRTKDVKRCPVPDDKVPWNVDFLEYAPVEFTSATVLKQPEWADPVDPSGIEFNCIDKSNNVDRRSYEGDFAVIDGYPRNPRGRTGVTGRGSLGRWGPNHAADPIVTRWKRDDKNSQVLARDGKPILQFVAVQRRDCGEWALPGGMVDPGENRTATLMREFGEEALNSLEATDEQKIRIDKVLMDFFQAGHTIYQGYVDDPRNTDNVWMETKAINFHDESGKGVGAFNLHAGDDAADVQWMDIDSSLKLYASHIDFIKSTVDHLKAHW